MDGLHQATSSVRGDSHRRRRSDADAGVQAPTHPPALTASPPPSISLNEATDIAISQITTGDDLYGLVYYSRTAVDCEPSVRLTMSLCAFS